MESPEKGLFGRCKLSPGSKLIVIRIWPSDILITVFMLIMIKKTKSNPEMFGIKLCIVLTVAQLRLPVRQGQRQAKFYPRLHVSL